MGFREVLEKLKSGGAVSEYRDERRITMTQNTGFSKLKRGKGVNKKLLIQHEFTFPFNPFSGQSDDMYNDAKPFRSGLAANTILNAILNEMAENEELKEFWCGRAGMSEEETANYKVEVIEDLHQYRPVDDVLNRMFNKYLVNREIIMPVVYINIPAITGQKFSINYAFEIERDEMTGEYEGDPIIIKFAKYFDSINFSKMDHIREEHTRAKAGGIPQLKISFSEKALDDPSKLGNLTDEDLKKLFSEACNDSPISSPSTKRFVLLYSLPVDEATGRMSKEYSNELKDITADSLRKRIRWVNVTKEIISTVFRKEGDPIFGSIDFKEVLMKCPTDTDDAMIIGKDTRYSAPSPEDTLFPTSTAVVPQFNDAANAIVKAHGILSEEIDSEDLDKVMRTSVRMKPYDEGVEAALISHYSKVENDIFQSIWVKDEDLTYHLDLINMINPELGDDISMEHDDPTEESMKALNAKIGETHDVLDLEGKGLEENVEDLDDLDDEETEEENKDNSITEEVEL